MASRKASKAAIPGPRKPSCSVGSCTGLILVNSPIKLCAAHAAEVVRAFADHHAKSARSSSKIRHHLTTFGHRLIAQARRVPHATLTEGPHEPVVYFIVNGNRVKIGHTTNLPARLQSFALRPDSVSLTLQGGSELERSLHMLFDRQRVEGTEWFELDTEILKFIATKEVMYSNAKRDTSLTDQIIEHLELCVSATPVEVARAIGGPTNSVRALMSQLCAKGRIGRHNGAYVLLGRIDDAG